MSSIARAIRAVLSRSLQSADFISAAQLDKLLRIRDYHTLGPDSRRPVLGTLGESMRSDAAADGLVTDIILESGVALVVSSALRVYASTALTTAWQSSGPDWGWDTGPVNIHAQGVMSLGAYQCAASDAPTWTGAETLDTANSYATRATSEQATAWLNADNRSPRKFTGLMRLAAQAFGPHADISELRPGSWPSWDPNWYGILRQRDAAASTLRWWLVYLGPSGCKAVALSVDPLANCLVEGLYAGSWGAAQSILAEAWVLRTLSLPDGATGTEVLTATQVADAHGGGYGQIAHGWHFSPQKWGTASQTETKAVILSYEDQSTYWDTKGCTVTVSFSGTTPSAAFAVTQTGSPSFGAQSKLWLPSGSGWALRLMTAGTGVAGLIWARYTDDGPEFVTYDGQTSASAGGETRVISANSGGCSGGGGESSSQEHAHVTATAAFSPAGAQAEHVDGAGRETNINFHLESFSTLDGTVNGDTGSIHGKYTSTTSNLTIETCPQNLKIFDTIGINNTVQVDTARGVGAYEIRNWAAGGGFGAALIIGADPTVIIAAGDESRPLTSGGRDIGTRSARLGFAISGSGDDGTYSSSIATGFGVIGFSGAIGAVSFVQDGVGSRLMTPQINSSNLSWTYGVDASSSLTETTAVLYTASGQIELSTAHDDWKTWCRPQDFGDPATLTGLAEFASYGGELLYTPAAGEDLESNDGHDITAVAAATSARFTGAS